MKRTPLQLIFGIIIGIAASLVFMKFYHKSELIFENSEQMPLKYGLAQSTDGISQDCPSSTGITSSEAKKLIYDYCSTTNCLVSPDSGKKIKGFYLDRSHIETIFETHPEADGIMVCLARQGSMASDPHTIVWMGYDCLKDKEAGDSIDLVYDDVKKTIFEFVKTCPSQCPEVNVSANNLWPSNCE